MKNTVDVNSQRKGWDVGAVFMALHLLVGLKVRTLGPRRPAAIGDPMSLWVGLFFLLWGAAFVIALHAEDRFVQFRLLNGIPGADMLGWLFLMVAAFLPGRYVGIW